MAYSKTITADSNSQISVLSTARGVVTVRVYFELTSVDIDLNPEQLSELKHSIDEAITDTAERKTHI